MAHALFILGELNDDDVDWMIKAGQREPISTGTVLIHEGKPVTALYIILDGALEVRIAARDRHLATLGRGEIVGEMSFVDAHPPSATVRALENSLVLRISQAQLGERLQQDPGFAARFYRAIAFFLSHRLREMDAATLNGKLAVSSAEPDELDSNVLDTVYLAGLRFERVLKRLIGD